MGVLAWVGHLHTHGDKDRWEDNQKISALNKGGRDSASTGPSFFPVGVKMRTRSKVKLYTKEREMFPSRRVRWPEAT